MKEAVLWKREKGSVRCGLCGRRCLIPEGRLGFCMVRRNIGGKLFSLNYGKIISIGVDPIEKKPLYHFLPGSRALSIASAGCNYSCKFCCNWQISQVFRDRLADEIAGNEYKPEDIVSMAKSEGCKSISYTYTEPIVFFEFALDTAKLASKKGLKNTFVTNGYMTPEAVRKISPYLDAATVDFKGSADPEFYREFSSVTDVKPIFDALLEMKRRKIHLEITDLIVPRHDTDLVHFKKLAGWVAENMGADTPFHILRFFPTYRMAGLPETPLETLERAFEIAKKSGLRFVYLGNVQGEKENTYCPKCGELLVERSGFSTVKVEMKGRKCPKCRARINIMMQSQKP